MKRPKILDYDVSKGIYTERDATDEELAEIAETDQNAVSPALFSTSERILEMERIISALHEQLEDVRREKNIE